MLKSGYEWNNSKKSSLSQSKNIFHFYYLENILVTVSQIQVWIEKIDIELSGMNGKNIEIEIR